MLIENYLLKIQAVKCATIFKDYHTFSNYIIRPFCNILKAKKFCLIGKIIVPKIFNPSLSHLKCFIIFHRFLKNSEKLFSNQCFKIQRTIKNNYLFSITFLTNLCTFYVLFKSKRAEFWTFIILLCF